MSCITTHPPRTSGPFKPIPDFKPSQVASQKTDAAKRSSPTADLPGPTFARDETSPGTVVPKQRFRPAALIGAVETTSRERQSP